MINSYSPAINSASQKYGVPSNILSAQIAQESGFNPNAISSTGALGIAQFMPATAASIGLKNPFDPTAAINAAAQYDAQNYAQFGNWQQALMAYNQGPTATAQGVQYPQAQAYADSILANSGTTSSNEGATATYTTTPNGVLNSINFSKPITYNQSGTGGQSTSTDSGVSVGPGICPINDTPIFSFLGYKIITPCGLWDLAVGLVGIVLIIAGFKASGNVIAIAKNMV